MKSLEKTKIDQEAVEAAFSQIHYYVNLPKHIKGTAVELKGPKPNIASENQTPAYVVNGATTVIMGKLNIPTVNRTHKFLKRLFSN